jgi:small subunit ribosomal protein S6
MSELNDTFRYNDAIIRNLVIRRKGAVTEVSPIKAAESREDRRAPREERQERTEAAETPAEETSAE